jgi:deazaflavin-dependent oxidoreductase (nitroreductase family)
MNSIHRLALGVSGGRLGWNALGMQVLELTTIGRRSGRPRLTLLTAPMRVGDAYVVVASRGGDDRHPSWLHNLRDEPRVAVAMNGGVPVRMTARIATPEERAQLWPQITANHPNYARYQRRTNRKIPLVLLKPLS